MSEFSLRPCLNMQASSKGFRKAITLRYAVALYVSSVLGSGVLVLPGLAAKIAGPGSLIAWILLSLASYPFAYTFASLSARRPESGGVYAFAKESLGQTVASMTGWLFAVWYVTGAPAVTLIAASYLAFAFPMSRVEIFIIAGLIIFTAFTINFKGIVVSNKVQLAVVISIIALLLATVAASFHAVAIKNFSPFLPNGLIPIGVSAALIFWSYLGYENVSNVAEEFENPKRDFYRSIMLSVVIVGVLYVSVAVMTVGTLAYKAGGSVAPFAAILSNVLGGYAAPGTAILAVFIIFSTVNAYMTGMSRVIYSTARDGGFPKFLATLDRRTGAPSRSLALLSGLAFFVIAAFYFLNVDLETALLIPSGAAIAVYVVGSIAGIKLLRGDRRSRILPWISLAITLVIMPFVGPLLSVTLVSALAGLAYSKIFRRPS